MPEGKLLPAKIHYRFKTHAGKKRETFSGHGRHAVADFPKRQAFVSAVSSFSASVWGGGVGFTS
jgi:hypothetical protein